MVSATHNMTKCLIPAKPGQELVFATTKEVELDIVPL